MPKSTYEYIIHHEPSSSSIDDNKIIKQAIQTIKKKHPAYGYRRVTGELHRINF